MQVTDAEFHSAGKSLHFNDENTGAMFQRAYRFPTAAERVAFDFWLKVSDIGSNSGYFQVSIQQGEDDAQGMNIWIDNLDGGLYTFDGSSPNSLGSSISLGEWQHFYLESGNAASGLYSIWLNGEKIASDIK